MTFLGARIHHVAIVSSQAQQRGRMSPSFETQMECNIPQMHLQWCKVVRPIAARRLYTSYKKHGCLVNQIFDMKIYCLPAEALGLFSASYLPRPQDHNSQIIKSQDRESQRKALLVFLSYMPKIKAGGNSKVQC